MKSEWRVTSQVLGDVRVYAVYRLLDVNQVDHSGNREEPKFRITFDKKVLKLLIDVLGKDEDIVHLQFFDEHGPAVWSVKDAGKKGAMLPLRVHDGSITQNIRKGE